MTQSLTQIQEISQTIMALKPEFEEMLRRTGVDPDRFTRCAIMAIQNTPALLECTKASLYKAVSTCARWGLIPDGQEAAIVKFGNEAVAMDMIEGVLKLFRNSGECGMIDAQVVFEKDTYDSWTDEKGVHFNHKRYRGKDRGEVILTYALAITKDGHTYFEEITNDEMAKIEGIARSKTVWQGSFRHEMYRKSALRRLSKRLPKSTDIEMAMDRHDAGFEFEPEKVEPEQAATTSSRLGEAIDAQATTAKSEPASVTDAPHPATQQEQPVDAPPPPTEPAQSTKLVQGIISQQKKTSSAPGAAQKWTRYGCMIESKWYGSFDSKVYDIIMTALNNRILVEVSYVEVVKDNKIYFEIKTMRHMTAADLSKSGDMPF